MAVEEGYDPRVMPQAGAAMPLANADTMGAGIGRAISQVGDTVQRIGLQQMEVERRVTQDRELADAAHKRALGAENMDGVIQEIRANPSSPDYHDHVSRVMQVYEAQKENILSGVTDPQVRRRLQAQLDDDSVRYHESETAFAEGQRVAKVVGDVGAAKNINVNAVARGAMNPADAIKAGHDLIFGLQNLTPVQRDSLEKDWSGTVAAAHLGHLTDTNPQNALAQINAGAFDTFLSPAQIEAGRRGAEVEIRRVAAEQERQVAVAKAAYRENVATAEERNRQGIDVSAELPALLKQATTFGDNSTVEKIKGLARDSAFSRVWSAATPLQRQNRIAEIARIAPEKRTPDQQAELKYLGDKGGALDSQFNADPVGFVIEHGKAGEQPPPINPQDPQSFTARARWQSQMQDAYGVMSPLSTAEATAMRNSMQQGANGKAEVANVLSQFPARVARQAARQVAPGDAYLQHVVVLPPENRHMALQGAAARKGDPKIINAQSPEDGEQFGVTARFLDQALITAPFEDRNAVLNAARDIAAYHIRNDGAQMTPGLWQRAVNEAMGARPSPDGKGTLGGLGNWQGHAFAVPRGLTAQQFTNNVFIAVKNDPGKGPVNPDKSPANLKLAFPVQIDEDVYQFRVGNNFLPGPDGRPWQYRVNRR